MPQRYLVTGRPVSGKSALAVWLCRRLPGPTAGLRALCTGRCAGGPRFSGQDLATGALLPLDREEDGRVVPCLQGWTDAAAALQAAARGDGATLLVDLPCPPPPALSRWQAVLAALASTPKNLVLVMSGAGDTAPALPGGATVLDLDATPPQTLREELAAALPAPLRPGVDLRLFREEKCFGPGPLQLLELVGRTGSLHRAAAAMGMAYSKAWKMLNRLEAQWGFAMVERHPGGTGGGGSTLTPDAWELLRRYRAWQWACEQTARREFCRWFGDFAPRDPERET